MHGEVVGEFGRQETIWSHTRKVIWAIQLLTPPS